MFFDAPFHDLTTHLTTLAVATDCPRIARKRRLRDHTQATTPAIIPGFPGDRNLE
jgi:hypothetical protein